MFFWVNGKQKNIGVSSTSTASHLANDHGRPDASWLALRSVYFEYRKRISEKSQSGGLQPLVDGAEGFNTTREACKAGAFLAFFLGMDTVVLSEVCLGEKWHDTENLNEEFWGQRPGLESC